MLLRCKKIETYGDENRCVVFSHRIHGLEYYAIAALVSL